MVLLHLMSAFSWGSGFSFSRSNALRTALHESMIVAYSRLLIDIS